jgi:CHAD domain-containing protein
VLAALQKARGNARLQMTVVLSKSRELESFRDALNNQPNATPLALAVAYDLISRTHHRVHLATTRLSSRSSIEDIHSLRRRIKRLRYSVEFFAPDLGKPAEEFIEHLKKLQNSLGDHQDNLSVTGKLRELRALSGPARESVDLVVKSIEARDQRLRERIVREAHKFGDKSWRNLRSKLHRAQRDAK